MNDLSVNNETCTSSIIAVDQPLLGLITLNNFTNTKNITRKRPRSRMDWL